MGATGSVLNEERLENVKPGGELRHRTTTGSRYLTAEALPAQHYGGAVARLALYRDDEPLAVMAPEKRMYWLEQQPASIPSVYSTLREDLYVILTAIERDGSATLQGLPQPARELDLDRRRRLRVRHPARDVAAPAPISGAPRMKRALGLAAALAAFALGAARAQETPDVPAGDAALRGQLVRAGRRPGRPTRWSSSTPLAGGRAGPAQHAQRRRRAPSRFERHRGRSAHRVPGRHARRRRALRRARRLRARRARAARRDRRLRADARRSPGSRAASCACASSAAARTCACSRARRWRTHSGRVIYVPPERRAERAPLLRGRAARGRRGLRAARSRGHRRRSSSRRPQRALLGTAASRPARHRVGLRTAARDPEPAAHRASGRRTRRPAAAAGSGASRASGPGCARRACARCRPGGTRCYAGGRIAAGGALDAGDRARPRTADGPRARIDEARVWLELDDVALDVSEQYDAAGRRRAERWTSDGGAAALHSAAARRRRTCASRPARWASACSRDPSGALALHGPIPPGETPLALRYRLPSASGGATSLARRFGSEVPLLEVFVADTGLRAQSPRMHRKRPVVTEDRIYLHLEAFALHPGEEVAIELEPLPARRAPARALALGVVLIGALGAGAFLLAPAARRLASRPGRSRRPPTRGSASRSTAPSTRSTTTSRPGS